MTVRYSPQAELAEFIRKLNEEAEGRWTCKVDGYPLGSTGCVILRFDKLDDDLDPGMFYHLVEAYLEPTCE